MTEYVHLVGTEEVQRAASRMQSAAETMASAASSIDHTMHQTLLRLEELIGRAEAVAKTLTENTHHEV